MDYVYMPTDVRFSLSPALGAANGLHPYAVFARFGQEFRRMRDEFGPKIRPMDYVYMLRRPVLVRSSRQEVVKVTNGLRSYAG